MGLCIELGQTMGTSSSGDTVPTLPGPLVVDLISQFDNEWDVTRCNFS